jgi:predicted dehydrogenase
MAVCDLDSNRVKDAIALVNGQYTKMTGKPYDGVTGYAHYRDLLANKDVDAVVISTPDHWHALIAIDAVRAGKDVYLQKPASLTIAEGRALSNEVHKSGRIFQIGSQQRSWAQFRYAAELVRNGRIGKLETVYVGLPGDPAGGTEAEMPVPKTFDYDAWLGSTPVVPYTEDRVHPQKGYGRPGWLRCEQFGAGMITGWGAHHIDSAHWGMDTEYTGPIEIWGSAEFPTKGLWNVHGPFKTEALYANGVRMVMRRVHQRHQVRGDRGLDFRVTRKRSRHRQRPRRRLERQSGPGRERSEDHHVGDRQGRNSSPREQGSPRELARMHQLTPRADRPGRDRPPRLLGLPAPPHRHEGEPEAALGPGKGALQERRRGERAVVASAASAVRARYVGGRYTLSS